MKNQSNSPWRWIPTLYFAEGIPYVIVATTFAMTMYTQLGISNAEAAFYTSWLYLPWVIKPFWSPFVDAMKTKRWWILLTQLLIGAGLACVAFVIPTSRFFQLSIAVFWLLAFSSATHDIAADGFYMLALSEKDQSLFVGIRSTFYRVSMVVGQGALVCLAGYLEESTGNIPLAWSATIFVAAGLFFLFAAYHFFVLPKPSNDCKNDVGNPISTFFASFTSFFQKKNILLSLAFVLLYRLGEAQLAKLASPFLLASVENGGLGMSTIDVGVIYGTVGVVALVVGGILGGICASRDGLKKWLWPMIFCMNLPDLAYVYMSVAQPVGMQGYLIVNALVVIEQFGYGYGFTAFMLYLIYISQGSFQTSHYAICTGFMALGMMLPGMFAGWIQEQIGYQNFFLWVCLCTIPGMIIAKFLKIDENFGRKNNTEN